MAKDIFLALIGVFGAIIVAYVTHGLAKTSDKKQNFKDRVQDALHFKDNYLDKNLPVIVKDRAAQQLIESRNINYREAVFFFNVEDGDALIRDYLGVRAALKPIAAIDGKITGFELKGFKYLGWLYNLGYLVSASIAVIPFLNFHNYLANIESYFVAGNYVYVFNMVMWLGIFMLAAVVFIMLSMQRNDAKKFIKKLHSRSIIL